MDALILARVDGGRPPENREAAELRRLGETGTASPPQRSQIISGLRSSEIEVRQAAAWALTQLGDAATPAVPDLERSLKDPDLVVRCLSALALRSMTARAVAPILPSVISSLQDKDANVRLVSADIIARQQKHAVRALPDLIAASQVQGEEVRVLRSLAAAMGAIGPEASAALPVLKRLELQPRVRWAAQAAIRQITAEPSGQR